MASRRTAQGARGGAQRTARRSVADAPQSIPSIRGTPAASGADDVSVIERMAMTPDDRLLLTPTEAARRLSIGRTLCYDLLRRGELASITIGARRCIPVAALDAYIQARLASEGFASLQGYGA